MRRPMRTATSKGTQGHLLAPAKPALCECKEVAISQDSLKSTMIGRSRNQRVLIALYINTTLSQKPPTIFAGILSPSHIHSQNTKPSRGVTTSPTPITSSARALKAAIHGGRKFSRMLCSETSTAPRSSPLTGWLCVGNQSSAPQLCQTRSRWSPGRRARCFPLYESTGMDLPCTLPCSAPCADHGPSPEPASKVYGFRKTSHLLGRGSPSLRAGQNVLPIDSPSGKTVAPGNIAPCVPFSSSINLQPRLGQRKFSAIH